jgi:hypothetical protein
MFNPLRSFGVIGLLGAGLLGGASLLEPPQPVSHDEVAGTPDLVVRDAGSELKRTHVTAYLTREHAPGTSLLWCATFQIAWDQFKQVQGGASLRLQGDPAMAVELSANPFPANALDEGSYVALIGKGPSTVGKIEGELARKFKGRASPKLLPSASQVAPDELLAYAYLFKNLAFEHPLSKLPDGMAFWEGGGKPPVMCRGFGIYGDTKDWSEVASQVTVWKYAADDDFVIELRTKEAEDRLIIARVAPGKTLRETVDAALAPVRGGTPESRLAPGESVEVPVLNFDVTRSYDEVANIPVTTPGAEALYIRKAMQNFRFRLDEKGAVLKSEAVLMAPTSAAPREEVKRRRFVCDGPFVVVMERKGAATPYFAAWVENAEVLVKK